MSDDNSWVFVSFDERAARKHGLPRELPVRKGQIETLAEKGIPGDAARKWVQEFLQAAPSSWRQQNGPLASKLDAFLGKGPSWTRAQQAFAASDWTKAISALQMVARLDPDDHAAKLNLAMAHANAHEAEKALARFEEIRATFTGDPEFHLTVANVLVSQGKKDEAITELTNALEAKPDHKGALDAMVKMGVLVKIYEDPRDARSLNYVRSDAVAEWLTSVWDGEARDEKYYLEQLAYHEGEQRWEVALAAADRAIEKAGSAGSERAELARIAALRASNRIPEATGAAEAYLARAATSAGAHVEMALCRLATGDQDAAVSLLDRALEIDPSDTQALTHRFWPARRDDLAEVAARLPALRIFAEAHPTAAGAWRSVARAELVAGLHDAALATFEKAVSLAPSDDDLRGEWWAELSKQRRFQQVIEDAARVGDLKGRSWTLRWAEAEAYAGLGRKVEAQGAFTAINLDESLHVDVRRRAKRAVQQLLAG